jgi:spermidine synthase
MAFWVDETFEGVCRVSVEAEEQLYSKQSEFQLVEIFQTKGFGRVLTIDGMFMTSERDEHFYHEMLVQPPLACAPSIERVLVIGGGDGGTVREVLSHKEVEKVVMVEIDGQVVEASKKYLPTIGRAWDDPRLEVRIADGIEYVKNAKNGSFDVILLDHSDPVGPAAGLFNVAFYKECHRILTEKGVFAMQSESPLLQRETFLEIKNTLADVFSDVHPYFSFVPLYGLGGWSFTFASNGVTPFEIVDSRVSFQEERCKHYNREIHKGAFALPNDLKRGR